MKDKYIGFHGTSVDNAKKIMSSNFKMRKAVWFGMGVYFFKDTDRLAKMWAQKKFKNSSAVLKSDIEVEAKYTFDLTNPNNDDTQFFHEVRKKKILEGIKIKGDNFRFDTFVIEFIHQKMGIDVFLAHTYTYEEFDENKNKAQRTKSRIPNGIEIIVKNTELIKNKKVI